MPWHISANTKGCSGFAVVKDADGSIAGCHKTKADAQKQLAALYANVKESSMESSEIMPRDNLVRSAPPLELRAGENGGPEHLVGHFAVFNEWTEIDSVFEGRFMERIAPGAFRSTVADPEKVKVLYNHGRSELGDQILGSIVSLEEDAHGAAYDVELFDGIPPLLMSGLRAGKYGASFRFRVDEEDIVRKPGISEHNPEGLPERTILDAPTSEFGPVTFPAYAGATAVVRSLTDEFVFSHLLRGEGLAKLAEFVREVHEQEEKTGTTPPPVETKRIQTTTKSDPPRFRGREEFLSWLSTN